MEFTKCSFTMLVLGRVALVNVWQCCQTFTRHSHGAGSWQLAQHSMPTVGSVVAAVSALSPALLRNCLCVRPLLSLWVTQSDSNCLYEWVHAGLCVSLSQVLFWAQEEVGMWFWSLNHNTPQLIFMGNSLHSNWASTASGCTAVASLLFQQQIC